MFKLIVLSLSLFCWQTFAANVKPWEPYPNEHWYGGDWFKVHETLKKNSQNHKETIKAIFIGASITGNWPQSPLWNSYYVPKGGANYGIGGDSPSNVLWRIANQELDGLNPKIVIMTCGTSDNLDTYDKKPTHEEVLKGEQEVAKQLRLKFPKSKLFIVANTPYPDKEEQATGKFVNDGIQSTADNKDIFYIDLTPHLTDKNGKQIDSMFVGDHVHLTAAGYQVWHDTMRPLFEKYIQ